MRVLQNMQPWHLVLSLQDRQIFDGPTRDGKNLTMESTAAGMDLPITQARRQTDTAARAEAVLSTNSGVLRGWPVERGSGKPEA
ncbi:hypothetical protein LQZ19_04525 [Treponema primitia]|uniref:hypothetical protein n=1 Tax=Treponema primitia TaxID=88058 RepID=UPI00397FA2E8